MRQPRRTNRRLRYWGPSYTPETKVVNPEDPTSPTFDSTRVEWDSTEYTFDNEGTE